MQVTQIDDHVTNAVIGGSKKIEMGISDSAEFYHMLSSTLYSDQKLAVVRETVCNAWDAHIDSNRKHIPIAITVADGTITIRDYGYGIAKDLMGPIYGVYGNSTKKNDGNATGGFGLGCKAPFSYTDNFQVTSHHEGTRTIYNMSRSSASVGGKPAIIPIASFPTAESGLEVVIRVVSNNDSMRFMQLFKRIIFNGGIRATLNGKLVNTLKTYALKDKFFVTTRDVLETHKPLAISYGNVIYPLDQHAEYAKSYNKAIQLVNEAVKPGYNTHSTLVLIAPANSISVTPSRESLSMQSHTIDTVKILLELFVLNVQLKYKDSLLPYIQESVHEAVRKNMFNELLTLKKTLPSELAKRNQAHENDFLLMTYEHLTKLNLTHNYPDRENKFDLTTRVRALMKSGHTNLGMGRSYLQALNCMQFQDGQQWVRRHVIWPMLRKIQRVEGMSTDRLFLFNKPGYYERVEEPVPATKVGLMNLKDAMPLLRNVIVLCHTRKDISDRLRYAKALNAVGNKGAMLVYVVARSQNKTAEARELFASTGALVIDLTVPQEGENVLAVMPKAVTRPVTPRQTGLPKMDSALDASGKTSVSRYWHSTALRIAKPAFVALCSDSSDGKHSSKLNHMDYEVSEALIKLFGSVGGICKTTNQVVSYKEKGAKGYSEFLLEKVPAFVSTNPYLLAKQGALLELGRFSYDERYQLANRLNGAYKALVTIGLLIEPTPEELLYEILWNHLLQKFGYKDEVIAARNILQAVKQSDDSIVIEEAIQQSKLMEFLDTTELVSGLQSSNSAVRNRALKMLEFAIS